MPAPRGIAHCDIKPENIALMKGEHSVMLQHPPSLGAEAKLLDFGSACRLGKDPSFGPGTNGRWVVLCCLCTAVLHAMEYSTLIQSRAWQGSAGRWHHVCMCSCTLQGQHPPV